MNNFKRKPIIGAAYICNR